MTYGLEVYDASGNLRVDTTSSFVCEGAFYNNVTVLNGTSTPAYSIPGIDSATWKVIVFGTYDDGEASTLSYTIDETNDEITFTNSDGSGRDWTGNFYIYRDGTTNPS